MMHNGQDHIMGDKANLILTYEDILFTQTALSLRVLDLEQQLEKATRTESAKIEHIISMLRENRERNARFQLILLTMQDIRRKRS